MAAKAKSKTSRRRAASKSATKTAKGRSTTAPVSKWSADVMRKSDAMDLQPGVFTGRSARAIALSLKKSAEASHRRKASPFQSAMSMLNFEINRGGTNLSAERRRVLNQAKNELRKAFDRPTA